jgi:hypothetical protein
MDTYDSISAEGHCSTVMDDITPSYLQLIQVKKQQKQLNAATRPTQLKTAKSKSLKASDKVIANLEADVKKAAQGPQARENAIETVQKALANDHASELDKEINRAVRIQKLVDGGNFPAKHLRTKGHMDAREGVHAEHSEVTLLQFLGAYEAARSALPPCTHLYEEALARVRSLQAILRPHGKFWMPPKLLWSKPELI